MQPELPDRRPFSDPGLLRTHAHVVGGTGSGKSSLCLAPLLLRLIETTGNPGQVFCSNVPPGLREESRAELGSAPAAGGSEPTGPSR